jgi:tetratricopeptide (TPR) repeat protein
LDAVPEVDLAWCKELAEHGEEAALALGDHEGLLELLDLSAKSYYVRGAWQDAEAAWLGALSIVDDLGDVTRFVHFLNLLATTYRSWGRPHKTVDMLLEIASVQAREGDVLALAGTLAAVGTTFLDADGMGDAETYLRRADRLLHELPAEDATVRARRAAVLSDLGRLHARRGAINSARTAYHEALVLALDIGDDALADRVRAWQTALPSA